jgi:hypothetical protein
VLRDPRSVPPPVAVALQSQEKIEQACRVSAVCDVWQYAINHRVLIHQNLWACRVVLIMRNQF